jgi:hypothetical protein
MTDLAFATVTEACQTRKNLQNMIGGIYPAILQDDKRQFSNWELR